MEASGTSKHSANVILNPIDRALHLINGLQARAQRNIAILSALIGGLGVSTFLGVSSSSVSSFSRAAFGDDSIFCGYGFEASLRLIVISIAFLIASVGVYSAAMRQITVFNRFEELAQPMSKWEKFVFSEIRKLEIEIALAGYLFGLATFLIFLATSSPIISCL